MRIVGALMALAAPIVLDHFAKGEFDVCTLIYNRFKNVISQTPVGQQLIPAPLPETSVEGGAQYEFEPTEEEILARLLPHHRSGGGGGRKSSAKDR